MTQNVVNTMLAAKPNAASFASNEVRLSARQWIVTLALIAGLAYAAPVAWQSIEPLEPGPDYRIPFSLGSDYWMYDRYCHLAQGDDRTLLIGDSVVWGHYVATEETLSHYLNAETGSTRFVNYAVDGVHPIAMSGLLEYYGKSIARKDVILQCNLLWMSSPRHDLQADKAFSFNHPKLVPQFYPRIPCYAQSLSGRLDIAIARSVPLLGWTEHLRIAYFQNTDIPNWTIEHPYEDPLSAITLELPSANESPSPKPIAKPWTQTGMPKLDAQWVTLDSSLQWRFFQQAVEILKRRGNRVFVLVGPFNEHMLTPTSLQAYQQRKQSVAAWLEQQGIPHFVAPVLPSECYADASHPLADGYALLAKQLSENQAFSDFQTR